MNIFRNIAGAAVASLLLGSPVLAVEATSITFAQFTQQTSAKIAQYGVTATGNTLTILNAPTYFVVTAFGTPGVYNSLLSITASSSSTVVNTGPQFEQAGWDGQMNFTNGVNQFTVDFTDAVFNFDGNGGSGSLISTDPNNFISYSSDLLTFPLFAFENFALAFTGGTPQFAIGDGGYGKAFNASVAGSFAGTMSDAGGEAVPEPASWAMMLAGFGIVGWTARRRSNQTVMAA